MIGARGVVNKRPRDIPLSSAALAILVAQPRRVQPDGDEPPLIDATAPALAIGQQVEAALDRRVEQLRAPATAVDVAYSVESGNSVPKPSVDTSGKLLAERLYFDNETVMKQSWPRRLRCWPTGPPRSLDLHRASRRWWRIPRRQRPKTRRTAPACWRAPTSRSPATAISPVRHGSARHRGGWPTRSRASRSSRGKVFVNAASTGRRRANQDVDVAELRK
jgi:hypothetical protein